MSVLDLLLPGRCAGCGAVGGLACPACAAALRAPARPAWPSPAPAGLPPPWTLAAYDGPVRKLILAYKERGLTGLRPLLGGALARPLAAAAGDRPVLVVPAPSARQAIRQRGDDVVLGLARRGVTTARLAGSRVSLLPALRLRRPVQDSAGLSATDRAANLAGAFDVRRAAAFELIGADVVLLDDLITTGATLAEAAAVLRRTGARVIGAATLAATARRPLVSQPTLGQTATEGYFRGTAKREEASEWTSS